MFVGTSMFWVKNNNNMVDDLKECHRKPIFVKCVWKELLSAGEATLQELPVVKSYGPLTATLWKCENTLRSVLLLPPPLLLQSPAKRWIVTIWVRYLYVWPLQLPYRQSHSVFRCFKIGIITIDMTVWLLSVTQERCTSRMWMSIPVTFV